MATTTAPFTPAELVLITREAQACGFRLHGDTRDAERFLNCQAGLYRLDIQYRAGHFDGQLSHAD